MTEKERNLLFQLILVGNLDAAFLDKSLASLTRNHVRQKDLNQSKMELRKKRKKHFESKIYILIPINKPPLTENQTHSKY